MKLSDWAKSQGISYLTAYRWFRSGKLPQEAFQTDSGTILIQPKSTIIKNNKVWIYCRVSSHEKKLDLERQAQRCLDFAQAQGLEVISVYKEVASGMNDNRKKLLKLLDENPSRILIEHKDRLTRFGFNYFDILLPKLNCELVVINRDCEEEKDLMKDLISIITSFCCRLYGLRRGQNKSKQIKNVLKSK